MVEEGLEFLILSSSLSPKRGITVLHTAPWERDLPDQMHGTGTAVNFWQGSQEALSAHFEIFYLIARHRARAHVSTPGSNASGLWLGFPLELGIKSRASRHVKQTLQPHPSHHKWFRRSSQVSDGVIQEYNSKGPFCTLHLFSKQIVGIGLDFTPQTPLQAMICTQPLIVWKASRWWHLDLLGFL